MSYLIITIVLPRKNLTQHHRPADIFLINLDVQIPRSSRMAIFRADEFEDDDTKDTATDHGHDGGSWLDRGPVSLDNLAVNLRIQSAKYRLCECDTGDSTALFGYDQGAAGCRRLNQQRCS